MKNFKLTLLAASLLPVAAIADVGVDQGGSGNQANITQSGNGSNISVNQYGLDGNVIVEEIAPTPRDVVIRKEKASGFSSTPLASYLQLLKADSVLVTGTTTSGCVRATVLDAFALNFRCTVVEDACFDRSQASHAINLCDMHAKYANVLDADQVIDYVNGLPEGLFELPTGEGIADGEVWY